MSTVWRVNKSPVSPRLGSSVSGRVRDVLCLDLLFFNVAFARGLKKLCADGVSAKHHLDCLTPVAVGLALHAQTSCYFVSTNDVCLRVCAVTCFALGEKGCRIRVTHVHTRSDCVHSKSDTDRLNYASRFVRVIHSSHVVSIKLGTVTPLRRCGLATHER